MNSISTRIRGRLAAYAWIVAGLLSASALAVETLPGTAPLELSRDDEVVHARGMKQVSDYYQRRIAEARESRRRTFKPDFSSAQSYQKSLDPYRVRCRRMLGLVEVKAAVHRTVVDLVQQQAGCRIERVTIPILMDLSARGLMISPGGSQRRPAVIVCPDADTWPERFAGLADGVETPIWLSSLVEGGRAVFVMQSIERLDDHPYCKTTNNKDRREILYRLGYPVGRSMPGLDVQDVTAVVDYLLSRSDVDPDRIVLAGVGQGAMTALYTTAIDRRISTAVVIDYFQNRDRCWEEPVDRRMCGQLLELGDAELAALVAPRPLWISRTDESSIDADPFASEAGRAGRFFDQLGSANHLSVVSADCQETAFARWLSLELELSKARPAWTKTRVPDEEAQAWRDRHFEERLRYLRRLIAQSEAKRQARWKLSDREPDDFEQVKAEMLRDYRQLVGEVPSSDAPLNPKTELALETDRYKLYRVTLEVTEGVEVYGNLLVPNDVQDRRAAVICQHGLSGTPEMTTGLGGVKDTPYHEFARRLAEHGYVVFSPYLMQRKTDEINQLVRMADSVGMIRVAMPVAKTRRIIDFLQGLPFVDGNRIGYYGLSYGGYSAIWISPLAPRLAATVISGHFNDWRSKITNDTLHTSYLWHPDEDFYNWNILHRFTHPELMAMIAPRPVCVEFAQRDGITTPQWTAYAWKQVVRWRDHFGFTDRIELAHFDGVHEIQAVQTTDFLDRFLRPSRPVGRDFGESRSLDGGFTRYPHATHDGEPFVVRALDSTAESRLAGRFWIPAGAGKLGGMAVKLSRVGQPGPLEIRFGSRPGGDDLGTGRLEVAQTPTGSKASWHEVRIAPHAVESGQLVYFELRCPRGTAPTDQYLVYGPRPIGGKYYPRRFGLSYRVLTESAK